MRAIEEIQKEIAHVEYSLAVLDEHRTTLKAERDQHRVDDFIKAKVTKPLAAFFKAHGLYIVDLNSCERSKDHYALAKQLWRTPPEACAHRDQRGCESQNNGQMMRSAVTLGEGQRSCLWGQIGTRNGQKWLPRPVFGSKRHSSQPQSENDLENEARWTRKKHKRACIFHTFAAQSAENLLWFCCVFLPTVEPILAFRAIAPS